MAILLLALTLFLGAKAFFALVLVVGGFCAYEYFTVAKKDKSNVIINILLCVSFIMLCGFFPSYLISAVFGIILAVFAYNLFVKRQYDISTTLIDIWGFLYIGVSLSVVSSILLYRSDWLMIILFIICVAVLNDTMAYFIGVRFGKHKFCPVSPKKSIEGAIAGIITSMIVSLFFGIFLFHSIPFYHFIVLGFLMGIAGELGDLCASMIKRKFQVKDFGNLMPGHGGALDRIDNILFTVMAVYCYYQAFLFVF